MFTSLFTDYGVRPTGYQDGTTFKVIPEMIPEIVVPDLTGFKVLPLLYIFGWQYFLIELFTPVGCIQLFKFKLLSHI